MSVTLATQTTVRDPPGVVARLEQERALFEIDPEPARREPPRDDYSLADRSRHGAIEAKLNFSARIAYQRLRPELKHAIDRALIDHLDDPLFMRRASSAIGSICFNPNSIVGKRLNDDVLAAVFEKMLHPESVVGPPKLGSLHHVAEAAMILHLVRDQIPAPAAAQWAALDSVLTSALTDVGRTFEARKFTRADFCDLTTLDACTRDLTLIPKLVRSKGGIDEQLLFSSARRLIRSGIDTGAWVKEVAGGLENAKTEEDLLRVKNAALDYLGAERRYGLFGISSRQKAQDELTSAHTAFHAATVGGFAPEPIFERLRDAYPAWRATKAETAMEALVDQIGAKLSNPVESTLARAANHAKAGRFSLAAMVAKQAYADPLDRLAYVEQPDVLQYEVLAHLAAGDLEQARISSKYLFRFSGDTPGLPLHEIRSDEQAEQSNDRSQRARAIDDFLCCLIVAGKPMSTVQSAVDFAKGMDWHSPYHATMTKEVIDALRTGRRPTVIPELGANLPDHPAFEILKQYFAKAVESAPISSKPAASAASSSAPPVAAVVEHGERLVPVELHRARRELEVINRSIAGGPKPPLEKALRSQQFAREHLTRLMEKFRREMLERSTMSADEARLVALHIPLSDSIHATYGADAIQTHLADALRWTNGVGCRHLHVVQSEGHGSFAFRPKGLLSISTSKPTEDELRTAVFHEFGHHREFEDDATKALMFGWRKQSASSERPVKWEGYSVFPGNFVNPYVGRDYGDQATEVLSVGLEHLRSTESMVDLMLGDKSHFFLMIGLLRGYVP